MMKYEISVEELRENFSYNPETGDILRLKDMGRWGRLVAGTKAGCFSKRKGVTSYVLIRFQKQLYFAHKIAWALQTGEWPTKAIDHVDCDPSNNKWDNLRGATQQENTRNQTPQKGKTSIYKGVCWDRLNKKWTAQSKISGVKYHLGCFSSELEAAMSYNVFAEKTFGRFAKFNQVFGAY